MNALFAGDDADVADNPWLALCAPKMRRERRRSHNALYKEHGNGPWVPFVPITTAQIQRAAAACR